MKSPRHKQLTRLAAAWLIAFTAGGPPCLAARPVTDRARNSLGRVEDYERVMAAARAWFDELQVDPVALLQGGKVKGKKKLSEIITVYTTYLDFCKDEQERAGIMRRLRELAWQATRPEYHDIAALSEKQLIENSMSYFRVPYDLERCGFDMSEYRAEIVKAKAVLDEHLRKRGPWQRAMFAEYYDYFGLDKPDFLRNSKMQEGVIARRIPHDMYDKYDPTTAPKKKRVTGSVSSYDLTHEIFVAYDYGNRFETDIFTAADRLYARNALRALIPRFIAEKNPDLSAELVSCLTYLGFYGVPEYIMGVHYLLDVQNPNGSWGDYEYARRAYGNDLEVHVYLHTTEVAVRALLEAYEGSWPPAGPDGLQVTPPPPPPPSPPAAASQPTEKPAD